MTLDKKSTFSLNEPRLYGIEIHYKGIDFPISYEDVMMELKMGEGTTIECIMVNIIQKINRRAAQRRRR